MAMDEYHIYTDGSCKPNPGRGGWAAIIRKVKSQEEQTIYGAKELVISGSEAHTTNNRMEMMAVIKALEILPMPGRITVYSDSLLLVNTMSKNWRRNKNRALWEMLDTLTTGHIITWVWVRGHNGHPENERVDTLAQAAAQI